MVLVLFEELLWGLTGGIMRLFGRFPAVASIEDRIRRLPPILALPLFVLPWLIMLPVKLGALWWIARGRVLSGTLLFLFGEAFGVAFLARLYDLCRPALHRWSWFVVIERLFLRWTQWAHDLLHRLPPVRAGKAWSLRRWENLRAWAASARDDGRHANNDSMREGINGGDRK